MNHTTQIALRIPRYFLLACPMALAPCARAATASGPITLSDCRSTTISGKRFTSGANGAAIHLANCQDVVIEHNQFDLDANNIGIQIVGGRNITIRDNSFHNVRSGVYALNTTGGIDIHCNTFQNIAGAKPRGQMVQFNHGTGPGNSIAFNALDHDSGTGFPEDLINLYGSAGTSASPLRVAGNHLRGGGPSTSGGGIMAGDNDGHDILIEDNILVDPGQYGIGIPAGRDIAVRNNTIYGRRQPFTNVGLYVGLKSEIDAGFACAGSTIQVSGNRVNWTNKNGVPNDFYFYSGCPGVAQSGNAGHAPLAGGILPAAPALDPARCPEATASLRPEGKHLRGISTRREAGQLVIEGLDAPSMAEVRSPSGQLLSRTLLGPKNPRLSIGPGAHVLLLRVSDGERTSLVAVSPSSR